MHTYHTCFEHSCGCCLQDFVRANRGLHGATSTHWCPLYACKPLLIYCVPCSPAAQMCGGTQRAEGQTKSASTNPQSHIRAACHLPPCVIQTLPMRCCMAAATSLSLCSGKLPPQAVDAQGVRQQAQVASQLLHKVATTHSSMHLNVLWQCTSMHPDIGSHSWEHMQVKTWTRPYTVGIPG